MIQPAKQTLTGEAVDELLRAVSDAGAAILRHREAGIRVERKADASPVTAADREAERILLSALAKRFPDVAMVAEEEAAAGRIPSVGGRFFLVDPLDGTKEFVQGGTDFTVNIGLIEDGAPCFGIVFAPARNELCWGDVAMGEAWLATPGALDQARPIRCGEPAARPRAVASKSHDSPQTTAYLEACGAGERLSVGSSLKFLLVASGQADLYPRAGATMEWDTAAGDAILRAAGGMTYGLDGQPLRYGKADFFNPGFVAGGRLVPAPLAPFFPHPPTGPGRHA